MKKQLLYIVGILIVLQVGLINTINAASFTWTGTTSSSWSVAGNWSGGGGGTPGSGDNITINSNAPNNLVLNQNRTVTNFTINGDTLDLGTYTLTTTGVTYFNGGLVNNGNLSISGSLCHFGGATIDARIEANCGYYHMNGGVFNKPTILVSSGSASTSGTGNCTFADSLSITNNGSYYFTMSSTHGNNYNGPVTIVNNATHEVFLSTSDTSYYKNLIINNTSSGGVILGNLGGVSYLDSGKTISIGSSGFSNNYLTLKNFYQIGSTAQTLALTGTAILNLINAKFDGNLTLTSPGILLKNSTFNGTTSITRNGSSGNFHCDGGNTFYGALTLDNAGSSGRVRMANTTADTFWGNVIFGSSGGQDVQIAYSGENQFLSDITLNSSKVVFNSGTGNVLFNGASLQSLNGSYNFSFKKIRIDKIYNKVTPNTTLSVDDTLFLMSGQLITSSTNLLTMKAGSRVTGASDASFVSGPVKKIGSTAFEYPVGKKNHFQPFSISAPTNSTDSYIVEYFDDGQTSGEFLDTTLAILSDCNYWNYSRSSGTSNVKVSLSWDIAHCPIVDTTHLKIATWQDTTWQDVGHGSLSGNYTSGKMATLSNTSDYGKYILAYDIGYNAEVSPEQYIQGDGFVENLGQLIGTDSLSHPEIHYYGSAGSNSLFLSDTIFSYGFAKGHEEYLFDLDSNSTKFDSLKTYFVVDSLLRIDLILKNANPEISMVASDTSQGYKNYFLGYLDTSYTHALTYQEIKYENIFDNVDIAFYSEDEFRFYLSSTALSADIEYYYRGADSVKVDGEGQLNIYTKFGYKKYEVTGYEWVDEIWRSFDIEFNMTDSIVKFELGSHEEVKLMVIIKPIGNNPGVINPQNKIKWSTYYGRGFDNQLYNVKIDDDNNIYAAGKTQSVIYPLLNQIQINNNGSIDMTIVRFLPGRNRAFSTYYGGSGVEIPLQLGLDNFGNIGIVGMTTSTDFPFCLTCTGYTQVLSGTKDGVLLKLSNDGIHQLLSTYYGGSEGEEIFGIGFDSNNSMIVSGFTLSGTDLPKPTIANAVSGYDQSFKSSLGKTGFLAKFDNTNELIWRTYYGGSGEDECRTIAVDKNNNNFYVNGIARSNATDLLCSPCSTNTTNDFPICGPSGATIDEENGGDDIFVSLFNASNFLVWSTLHGGSNSDIIEGLGTSMQISPLNNDLVLVGYTYSSDFPILYVGGASSAYYDNQLAGLGFEPDGFLIMYNSSFELEWSTYYGGSEADVLTSISMNNVGKFYVGGTSASSDFETQASSLGAYFQPLLNGSSVPSPSLKQDGVLLKFNENYQRLYSTFWGGADRDYLYDVSFQFSPSGNQHNIVMVGVTNSDNATFPLKDIPGALDFFDGQAITAPIQGDPASFGPTAFVSNLYNVSTPLRMMNTNSIISLPELENSLKICPNPFFNSFLIQSSLFKMNKIILYDIHGKQIYKIIDCNENYKSVNIQNLKTGMYLLKIETIDGSVSNFKLIKN